ncbi:diguanylate cyclase [Corallococcus sp. bb12-1]|uniref:GGDEF domain-containing protein n=1 Tax=Corallococcus sp. bb12-1 TaxID=2996784 RepID=UPI002270969A|nr:diguanylate cyclase [Corallococcus sp. bb12-1]MCY1042701.1 diguanylate cyclase [Corallococcus sp. bb12-1]
MADYKHDARFRELQFIAQFEQQRSIDVSFPQNGSTFESAKERQMVLSLVLRGMFGGPDIRTRPYTNYYNRNPNDLPSSIERQDQMERAQIIEALVSGQTVRLEMGHLGRLRLAELQDQLRASRLHEPFGILYDGRHAERDLAIAIMNVQSESPVSVAYLDMNGLKAFNEDGDHATGDEAIKAFFHAIEKAVSDVGDAYRKGGDEVVVVMPATPLEQARIRMRAALASLAGEAVKVNGTPRPLSSSCGVVVVNDVKAEAAATIHQADLVQKVAKERSKTGPGRRSVLVARTAAAAEPTVEVI